MTIRPGEQWGEPAHLVAGTPGATTDAEVSELLLEGHEVIRLFGGDLHRTIGQPQRHDDAGLWAFPIDVVWCSSDAGRWPFVAHLTSGSTGGIPELAIMNAGFWGDWELAPRGHPNDGRVEVAELGVPRTDRREFKRRVLTGSHLPHPGIKMRSLKTWHGTVGGQIILDGVVRELTGVLEVEVEPDALILLI